LQLNFNDVFIAELIGEPLHGCSPTSTFIHAMSAGLVVQPELFAAVGPEMPRKH